MKLLYGLKNVPSFAGTVVTIGNFDGVHRGHQALFTQLRKQADDTKLPLVIMLFEPQPQEYFLQTEAPVRITSLREKLQVLREYKIDYVYCLKFNTHLAQMKAIDFAKKYFFALLKARYLLVGEDFRFGRERAGDRYLLEEMGNSCNCVVETFPSFFLEDTRVSSTIVREALRENHLEKVAHLLGRPFSLCGRVISGDGRGQQWGIPTANLKLHRSTLPLQGVFCVQVQQENGDFLLGVANLGRRPTINGNKNSLEVHLFNFQGDLYGKMLQVFFLSKLRDEIKFSSVDNLIAQIHNDIAAAKDYFAALD